MQKEGAPTPRANDHQPQHQPDREYTLSETRKAAIWAELARITPALKESAAKVLTWLTAEALSNGQLSIRASCRDVTKGSGLAKSNAIIGARDLVTLRLIAKREGTATRPAAYLLRYAESLPFRKREGGPVAGPPVEEFPPFQQDHGPAQQDHRGPVAGPPFSTESQQNPLLFDSAPDVLSIDRSSFLASNSAIDRSSELSHTDAQREECRGLMMAFARHRCRRIDAHPPDKNMLSMMLNVCEWERLRPWLLWAIGTSTEVCGIVGRPPEPPADLGNAYAWLLKVAINNLLGIQPDEQKPTLELLRGGKQMYTRWHSEGLK